MRLVRTQPPVGYRIPVRDLVSAASGAVLSRRAQDEVLDSIANALGVRHTFGVSSGKAALAVVLSALHGLTGRRRVILPAYTCYSVPSAIVLAGLEPVPCDIATGSFDYDYSQLQGLLGSDVLCVLSVDLFGIPANTPRVVELCAPMGIFVVEDAAQGFGIQHEGRQLGARGDVGFFSFGRGKNITSGAGGIIVTDSPAVAGALTRMVAKLPSGGAGDDVTTFLTLTFLTVFVSPSLYWLPAGLPFLRLGETIFHESFPVRRLSRFKSRLLRGWAETLPRLNDRRRAAADYYLSHVNDARDYAPGIPYLRFPILMKGGDAVSRILDEGNGRLLGISRMYPASIGSIPQLERRIVNKRFPEAERVAASLLTLPTHPLLTRDDLASICQLVNGVCREVRKDARHVALAGQARMR